LFRDHSSNQCNEGIVIDKGGNITTPACSAFIPNTSASGNGKILFMRSILGGKELHYNRIGPHQSFQYEINVPSAGTYAFSARVVSPSWKQTLLLSLNGSDELISISSPFTVGGWGTRKPLIHLLLAALEIARAFDNQGFLPRLWCVD